MTRTAAEHTAPVPTPVAEHLPAAGAPCPPLWVAGVTGGVGTRTLARLLGAQPRYLTEPEQHVHVLVTNITAAAASWLPVALRHLSSTPVLAVVHTVPGPVPPVTRARLRAAAPHVRQTVHLPHTPAWTAIETPPDGVLPRRAARARDQILAAVTASTHRPTGRCSGRAGEPGGVHQHGPHPARGELPGPVADVLTTPQERNP